MKEASAPPEPVKDTRKPNEPNSPPRAKGKGRSKKGKSFRCEAGGRCFTQKSGLDQHVYWSKACVAQQLFSQLAEDRQTDSSWEDCLARAEQLLESRTRAWDRERGSRGRSEAAPPAVTLKPNPRGSRRGQKNQGPQEKEGGDTLP